MLVFALILIPLVGGLSCLLINSFFIRKMFLLVIASMHLIITFLVLNSPAHEIVSGWLAVDGLSKIFLLLVSLLFAASSFYGGYYLSHVNQVSQAGIDQKQIMVRDGRFCACLLFFLSTMSLVTVADNLGLLWVTVEATTLSSAPLIYFYRHHRSLEATWKYLIICSIGIAMALLGNYFLAAGIIAKNGSVLALSVQTLTDCAQQIDPTWLKAAFILFLVGYGTKMGLVPMHPWLPDAHSEAPAMVSALLSGALLNCAFLAILRVMAVLNAAGLEVFARDMMLFFGLVSMVTAAMLLVTQVDFKRLLAYSSVEHMGILALGVGLGGLGYYGSLLHAINHSLVKAALFLTAGNILLMYKTKDSLHLKALVQRSPYSACLWFAGILAILGAPPFGLFISELIILKAAISQNCFWVAVIYLLALAVAFGAMMKTALKMMFNNDYKQVGQFVICYDRFYEHPLILVPQGILLSISVLLGLWVPTFLSNFMTHIVKTGGG